MTRFLLLMFLLAPAPLLAQAIETADRARAIRAQSTSLMADSIGKRGMSRGGRVAIGVSIGAILGGAIGYGVGWMSCSNNTACDAPGSEYAGAIFGAILGGTLGAVIAYPDRSPSVPSSQRSGFSSRAQPIVTVRIAL